MVGVKAGLSSATLHLEWLSAVHMAALLPLLADPLVSGPANMAFPFDARQAELYLHSRLRLAAESRAASFVALLEGQPCGGATLHGIRPGGSWAEIGFWVGRPFWGRGLGAEIVALTVETGVLDLGLTRIEARCHDDNVAAHRTLTQLGFARTGKAMTRGTGTIEVFRWCRDHELREAGEQAES